MPPTTQSQEDLIKDISDRVALQLGERMTDERITAIVKANLPDLIEDPEIKRKMRFDSDPGDERLIGSKFSRHGLSAADIEMAYDLVLSLRGQQRIGGDGTYPGPSEELTNAFNSMSKAYYIDNDEAKRIDKQALDNAFGRIPKAEFRAMGTTYKRAWRKAMTRATAMDTTESGFGNQLVGAQYVGDLWDAAFQESRLLALLSTFEMTAPTAYLPVAVDLPEPMFVAESTSDVLATAQYPTVRTGSNRVQVDAKKLLIHQVWSGEMEEDSIVPLIPFYRNQAARSLAFYGDSIVLNGDTQTGSTLNVNLVDSTPASTKFYLAFNGMRKVGLIENTAMKTDAAGPITLAALGNMLDAMIDESRNVDWGNPNDPNDLVYVTDPRTARRITRLDEVLQAKVELANRADLLVGQVSDYIGHPIISTTAMKRTDATGNVSNTGGNNTKGQVVAFNRLAYTIGWRRRIRIETERIVGSDQTRIVYSLRMGLGRYNPGGNVNTQQHTSVLYDVDLS